MFFDKHRSGFLGRNTPCTALPALLIWGWLFSITPVFAQPEWVAAGPAPITGGVTENVTPDNEVTGAINAVQPHPTNPDIIFIGGVNSGVWKTENGTAKRPTWTQLTDGMPSLSAAELNLDPTDPTFRTLVAGVGRTNSIGINGDLIGLLRTTDGGANWTHLASLSGSNITGVASRGSIIVAASTFGLDGARFGLLRSTDGGTNFTQISSGDGAATGLPAGGVFDLVGDPNMPSRLYLVNGSAELSGGISGIYRSDDTGATWTKISDATVDLVLRQTLRKVELAVGESGGIAVGVCRLNFLSSLFYSGNGGADWQSLDVPDIHPGNQGQIHFSIAVDPTNPNIVYLGGDRMRTQNSPLGNTRFSGNLMRCDASAPLGSQCVHLSFRNDVNPPSGGTANSSAPHADSRDMAFDANGDLLQSDDGGIYRRTSPQDNTGDWFSINGNIQGTEHHNIAYDSNSNIILGGAQDNGTQSQVATGSLVHEHVRPGDGGDVAIDDFSDPSFSVRWFSAQNLLVRRRATYDADNNLIGFDFPLMMAIAGPTINAPFVTPIEMNSVDPDRMLFLGNNGLFESADQGDTTTLLTGLITHTNTGSDPISFGATDNPEVIYAGTRAEVWVRMNEFPNAPTQSMSFPGGSNVQDIAIHTHLSNTAFVATSTNVFMTTNGGNSWSDISGNLGSTNGNSNRSLVYIHDEKNAGLVVGSNRGTFITRQADGFGVWYELGDLPKAPVLDLDYDLADDLLVAATFGRGDFVMTNPLEPLCFIPPLPTSVTAATGNVINLTWSGKAAGYDIFRATGACNGGSFSQVATNINTTTFTDTNVTPGTIYSYQIRGTVDDSGNCVSDLTACVQAIACGNNAALYPQWGNTLSVLDFISCITSP